jgi:hypothetical protein
MNAATVAREYPLHHSKSWRNIPFQPVSEEPITSDRQSAAQVIC